MHRNLTVIVDFGQDVDVDTDLFEVELRIDQCVAANAADAGLKAAGRDRDTLTDA